MFDSTSFTKEMLSDPSKIMSRVISIMEASDTSDAPVITDPNNGFVMMLAGTASMIAKLSEKIDYVDAFHYRQRATNSEQLFPHLSEFDYVKIMAAPATLPFVFRMSRDWLVANAVYYDDNYNKIQIPATSFITMGGIVYSMYYPIDILVNRNTNAVSAFYNTETTNSLYSLDSNILNDTVEYQQNGLNWFQITFDMFQFKRVVTLHTVSPDQGFVKTLGFDDQFYAAKIFSVNADGSTTELAYSLDKKYYNFEQPTALLTVLSDTSQLKIEIPQIYFDNNQLSNTLRIELYSSKGKINYSVSVSDVQTLTANFDTRSSVFAAPLDKMPSWEVYPTIVDIEGGRNALNYSELHDAVVNNRLYSRVPITLPELTQAFVNSGFTPTRYIDDVTDRMYFATNTLTDTNGIIIPTFTGNMILSGDSLNGDPSTIIAYGDGYHTILPTTVFKTQDDSTAVIPLSNSEVATIRNLSEDEQVADFNLNRYVRQPFHVTLYTTPKSPAARVYNLMAPSMTNLVFIREHPFSAPQMSVLATTVIHQNDGTGGYRIRMSVGRSENIVKSDVQNFRVILTCQSKLGDMVYIPATYAGVDNLGNDVWDVVLSTNYHITNDEYLTVMMYNGANVLSSVEIPLTTKFQVITAFVSGFDSTIKPDVTLNNLLPDAVSGTLTAMTHQTMTIRLGDNLSRQVYCGVDTTWGNAVYATADHDIYFTTNVPIFQTNELGVMEAVWNDTTSTVEIAKIYDIGNTPASTDNLRYKTTQGTDPSSAHAVLHLEDTTGVLLGMSAAGPNVPVNSVVEAKTATTVTLSQPLTTAVPGNVMIEFINPSPLVRVTAAQSSAGATLTVASTANVLKGQSVFGLRIAPGSKVLTINSETSITLDRATSAAVTSNTLLTFINQTAPGVIKIAKGSVLRDANGVAQVITPPNNQFAIPSILLDGRLFASEDPVDQSIITTIGQKLYSYASQIENIAPGLKEVSDVYYKPTRTMGNATFGIGNSTKIRASLEMSFEVSVYLDRATYNNTTALTTMESTIYGQLNTAIQSPTIALSDIGKQIASSLGTSVTAVEITKFNGSSEVRLIALEETDCKPSIENILVRQADGTIVRKPNITVTFIPEPETVESVAYNKL